MASGVWWSLGPVDHCWGGLCVRLGGQFWGLAGGAVLRRGAGSLRGPRVVAAGSGPGRFRMGSGSGLPWAHHSMGGLVQDLVPGWLLWDLRCVHRLFFFLFMVLGRAVGWGGAFPLLGAAWVGLGDGGSQARAATTGVTAWFVCLFVFFSSLFVGALWGGEGGAFWVHSSSPNTVTTGPEPGGHQALLPCGGSQETGVPIAASLWLGELLYIPYPSPFWLLYTAHTNTRRVLGACVFCGV